jgi:flagellar biosynthesis chaperone FliJ
MVLEDVRGDLMGIGEKLGELARKAKEMLGQQSGKVEQGVDKAAEAIKEKTGGKYSEQIDKGADRLKQHLGGQEHRDG